VIGRVQIGSLCKPCCVDGLCTDQEDKMNRVDTGSVGITLVEGLEALSGVEDGLKGGNIFDMQSDIFCMAPTEKPSGEDQVLCMVGGGQGRSTPVDPCRCCRSRANCTIQPQGSFDTL